MAYNLRYGSSKYDKKPSVLKRMPMHLFAGVLAILMMVFCIFNSKEVNSICERIFPFLGNDVRNALSEMVNSIEKGCEPEEAAVVFCREVLYGQ